MYYILDLIIYFNIVGGLFMKFNCLIPELSVSDIQKSKEFYLMLGFHIMYERIDDKFCFLELEENQIMIEEVNDHWNVGELSYPFGRGLNLSMEVSSFDLIYQRLKEKAYPLFKDIMYNEYIVGDKKYVDCEFLVQDPDGYLLRFMDASSN